MGLGKYWVLGGLLVGSGAIVAMAVSIRQTEALPTLVTSKAITPVGEETNVGSWPANMVTTPDGKFIAVTNTGFRQQISIFDATTGKLVSKLGVGNQETGRERKSGLYYGLAFAPSEGGPYKLFASRGAEDRVAVYAVSGTGEISDLNVSLANPAEKGASLPLFTAGIALSPDGKILYVANNQTSKATNEKGSLSILDVATGTRKSIIEAGAFPLGVAALTEGNKVYVGSERDGLVSVFDVTNPESPKLLRNVSTGANPTALVFNSTQDRLFVANAGSDTISVIDTKTDALIQTVLLRPALARLLPGASPTGIAIAPDSRRIYVSLGDMNAIAVVDLEARVPLVGYIPAGWYPSSVALSADGNRLLVANAKGSKLRNQNGKPGGPKGERGTYIESIIEGTVNSIPLPDAESLKTYTAQVLKNNNIRRDMHLADAKALPETGIKHVVYIVKENRTYDQVLGDLPQGNGDPSLVLFGREVTPNQHALAERFVLLDNFYCAGDVSGDGWNWTTSGMANEYVIRNLPYDYSGRGRNYDYEGQNNGTSPDLEGLNDVSTAPGGYIWDKVAQKGLSYMNYGAFVGAGNAPTKKALVGHTDQDFQQYDLSYSDSEAWVKHSLDIPNQKKSFGKNNAPSRFTQWKIGFDQYVKSGDFPAFSLVRFGRNHTVGTSVGRSSPRAMNADNDYAVGQVVEAISKSPFWKDTAIFVLEDDAQDGRDHVDAHRSICFVISPHIKKATVDHRFYNTDSVLRTMETLLGLDPMSQYDASAPIMSFFDRRAVNADPFEAILPAKDIVGQINARTAYRAKDSAKLDFTKEDRVPGHVMEDILWGSVKGPRKARR